MYEVATMNRSSPAIGPSHDEQRTIGAFIYGRTFLGGESNAVGQFPTAPSARSGGQYLEPDRGLEVSRLSQPKVPDQRADCPIRPEVLRRRTGIQGWTSAYDEGAVSMHLHQPTVAQARHGSGNIWAHTAS